MSMLCSSKILHLHAPCSFPGLAVCLASCKPCMIDGDHRWCRVDSWPWEDFGLTKQKTPQPKGKSSRATAKRKQPSTGKQKAGAARKRGRKGADDESAAEESEEAGKELEEGGDDSDKAAPRGKSRAASRAAPIVKKQLRGVKACISLFTIGSFQTCKLCMGLVCIARYCCSDAVDLGFNPSSSIKVALSNIVLGVELSLHRYHQHCECVPSIFCHTVLPHISLIKGLSKMQASAQAQPYSSQPPAKHLQQHRGLLHMQMTLAKPALMTNP